MMVVVAIQACGGQDLAGTRHEVRAEHAEGSSGGC
jgi:hypothetical protein